MRRRPREHSHILTAIHPSIIHFCSHHILSPFLSLSAAMTYVLILPLPSPPWLLKLGSKIILSSLKLFYPRPQILIVLDNNVWPCLGLTHNTTLKTESNIGLGREVSMWSFLPSYFLLRGVFRVRNLRQEETSLQEKGLGLSDGCYLSCGNLKSGSRFHSIHLYFRAQCV